MSDKEICFYLLCNMQDSRFSRFILVKLCRARQTEPRDLYTKCIFAAESYLLLPRSLILIRTDSQRIKKLNCFLGRKDFHKHNLLCGKLYGRCAPLSYSICGVPFLSDAGFFNSLFNSFNP